MDKYLYICLTYDVSVGAKFSTHVQMDIGIMHEQHMDKDNDDLDAKRTKCDKNVDEGHEHDLDTMTN